MRACPHPLVAYTGDYLAHAPCWYIYQEHTTRIEIIAPTLRPRMAMSSYLASLFTTPPPPPVAMVFTTGDAHVRLMPKFSAVLGTIMNSKPEDYITELVIVEDGSEADLNLTYKEFLAASVDMDHIRRKRRIRTNGPGECATMLRVCLEVGLFCASRGRDCDHVIVFSTNSCLQTEMDKMHRVCQVHVINPVVMAEHAQLLLDTNSMLALAPDASLSMVRLPSESGSDAGHDPPAPAPDPAPDPEQDALNMDRNCQINSSDTQPAI